MASNDIIVRLRMLGAVAFSATADEAASSVRRIGDAAESTGKKGNKLNSALDRTGKALAPVWAMATRGSVALGAAGAAAVGMGLQFDAGMEQSRVAFTNLLGDGKRAQDMLDRLYKIAAHTPFEFPQLTQATQRMLGFGMSAKDVIPTMKAVGDAVAASGGGADQIDRVSTALGQIQAKGKVSSEELLQLAESGVPAFKILQDQMGMTGQQLSKSLQRGAIDANTGLDALVKGINKRYKGMAQAQSKTFLGQLSSLKDNAKQILGTLTQPLFDFLKTKVLPEINRVTERLSKWSKGGGMSDAFAKIGAIAGKAFRIASDAFNDLMGALEPAMPFIQNIVLPLLKGIGIGVMGSVVASFKILIPMIRIAAQVLGWIGKKAAPLRGTFEKIGIVVGVVFSNAILGAIGALGRLGGVFKIVAAAAKIAAIPLRILGGIVKGLTGLVKGLFGVLGRVAGIASKAASALLKPFTALASKFVNVGKNIVTAMVNGISSAPGAIMKAIKSILPGGRLGSKVAGFFGMQDGGILRSGMAWVGEAGPELLHVKGGAARVYPLPSPSVAPIPSTAGGAGTTITVPVYLDGRVIAEAVARRTADRRARR